MTLKCAQKNENKKQKYRYYRLNVRLEREKHVWEERERGRQKATGSFELDPLAWQLFCAKRLATPPTSRLSLSRSLSRHLCV